MGVKDASVALVFASLGPTARYALRYLALPSPSRMLSPSLLPPYSHPRERPVVLSLGAPIVVEHLVDRDLVRLSHRRGKFPSLRGSGETNDHLFKSCRRIAVERPAELTRHCE
jgi:hypothetical protein